MVFGEENLAEGYRASASFNHAFVRWTGRRPSKRQLGLAFREIATQTLRLAEIEPTNGTDDQKIGTI